MLGSWKISNAGPPPPPAHYSTRTEPAEIPAQTQHQTSTKQAQYTSGTVMCSKHSTVQCCKHSSSTVQCCTVRYSAVQYSTVLYSTVQCSHRESAVRRLRSAGLQIRGVGDAPPPPTPASSLPQGVTVPVTERQRLDMTDTCAAPTVPKRARSETNPPKGRDVFFFSFFFVQNP